MQLISASIHLCAILSVDAFVNGPVPHSASNNLRNIQHIPGQFATPPVELRVKAPLIYAPSISNYNSNHASMQRTKTALPALAIDSAQEGAWKAYLDDEKTGLIFYYNDQTGESIWKPPSPSFPKVQPTGFLEERMHDVRDTYLGSLSLKNDHVGPSWQSLASVFRSHDKKQEKLLPSKLESAMKDSTSGNSANVSTSPSALANANNASDDVPLVAETKDVASSIIGQSKHMQDVKPMENLVNALSSLNLDDVLAKFKGDDKTENNAAEVDQKKNDDNKNNNSEPPKKQRDDKFDFAQRIESTKAGLTGLVAGGTALVPFTIFQTLLSGSSDKSLQFLFDTGSGAVEAALFAIVYRYCVRDGEESNAQLGQGVWGAFAITRALSAGKGFDFLDAEMIQQIAFSGVESFAMFGAAKLAMDFAAKNGFVKRME